MDRSSRFGVAAALEAVRDAGLSLESPLGPTAGVVFGAGSGGYILVQEQARVLAESGPRRVSPFFLSHILPDAASGFIAIQTGAMGPNMAVISACATGTGAIGEAVEVIRRGDAELPRAALGKRRHARPGRSAVAAAHQPDRRHACRSPWAEPVQVPPRPQVDVTSTHRIIARHSCMAPSRSGVAARGR